ncbi:alpha-amylase family glycosyl hydrolase [Flavobacteriaceae bacterium LMO-SS05]
MKKLIIVLMSLFTMLACQEHKKEKTSVEKQDAPFVWEGANLYFLLIDRFNNGDISNDINFDRTDEVAKLRGFKGGDIKGVIQKIEDGYFTDLGVNAIWMTPIVEQIHGGTDEGTGKTYGFHGYWAKDWTTLDPNFGTKDDLKKLVEVAHNRGIRIVLDAVVNHTGPVTEKDTVWPDDWVRTGPACTFDNYENTVTCTLVANLPDIKTENNNQVELPPQLVEKWKAEGRYEKEMSSLDAFFNRTGYPRAPRYYIIKWLTDYIAEFGIDGYRADTVKHIEEHVWQEFKVECDYAFAQWKKNHPEKVLDENPFYLVGEVYNYNISNGKYYDFGDKKVNYFDNSFHSLINFEFKSNALDNYEQFFSKYSEMLHKDLKGFGVLNYLSSHDDSQPFDATREKPYETATKLLLAPGTSQIYYGDESARSLVVEGTNGDATLRSFMNWDAIEKDPKTQDILSHWQKIGQFRANHPAIGAGIHNMISQEPYVFSRSFSKNDYNDLVVVGLNLKKGLKEMDVSKIFKDGEILRDAYSGQNVEVKNGKAVINSEFNIALIERK